MFPHPFVPFLRARGKEDTPKTSARVETSEASSSQAGFKSARSVALDVEKAVTIMVAAKDGDSAEVRQQCRFELINTLPSESIDWGTINWVQFVPFKTNRLMGDMKNGATLCLIERSGCPSSELMENQ